MGCGVILHAALLPLYAMRGNAGNMVDTPGLNDPCISPIYELLRITVKSSYSNILRGRSRMTSTHKGAGGGKPNTDFW